MARVLVFDVIETLLDLRPLREPFVRVFGDPSPWGSGSPACSTALSWPL